MALAAFNFTVTDESGNILNGATVEVRLESTGTLASIYSDRAGAIPMSNSYVLSNGAAGIFYAEGGAYKITATKDSLTRTWRYVPIGTGGENDIEVITDTDVLSSVIVAGSATALTTNIVKNVTSIVLPEGDWDVSANVAFIPAASTSHTLLSAAISQTSATLPSTMSIAESTYFMQKTALVTGAFAQIVPLARCRIIVAPSTTTTVYLVAFATFTVSTMSAYGAIWARKVSAQ